MKRTKKFILWSQLYAGHWQPAHALMAYDEAHALRTAVSWARYHGFPVSGVRIEAPTDQQATWQPEAFFDRFINN